MSVPSPPLGPQSDWCVPYLPLCQGQDSLWNGVTPVWATCTLPGCSAALMGSGVSRGVSEMCTGARGAGLAHFAIGGPLREGPCSTRREADLSEGWIHTSPVVGICEVEASPVRETGSLWNFGWGMGEGNGTCQCLCSPVELSSVFQGSTYLPTHVLLPSCCLSRAIDL